MILSLIFLFNLNVSAKCDLACQAVKKLSKTSEKQIPRSFGGKSPSFMICTEFLKGHTITKKDKDKNESMYCLFDDGSKLSEDELLGSFK